MCTQEVRKTQIPPCCDLIEWSLEKKKWAAGRKESFWGCRCFWLKPSPALHLAKVQTDSAPWEHCTQISCLPPWLRSIASQLKTLSSCCFVMHGSVTGNSISPGTFARKKTSWQYVVFRTPPPSENMDHKRFPSCITWWNKMYLKTAEYVYAPEYIMGLLLFFFFTLPRFIHITIHATVTKIIAHTVFAAVMKNI